MGGVLRYVALIYLEGKLFQLVDWYIKEVRKEIKKDREKRKLKQLEA